MFKRIGLYIGVLFLAALTFYVHDAEAATEYEPNDEVSEANPINFTNNKATAGGVLSDSYDEDYYSVTLSNPGKIDVKINRSLSTRYRVILYNAQREEMEDYSTSYNADKGAAKLFSQGLPAGTYYIRVDHYEGNSQNVNYQLEVDYKQSNNYEKEFNNDRYTANPISLNNQYNGWADSDSDFYVFELPSDGEVKVALNQALRTKYEISLYDASGNEMEDWYTYYGIDQMITPIHIGLPKGTYYLRVRTDDGEMSNIPYRLKVNFKATSSIETEDNESRALADSISLNKAMKGIMSWSSDFDYYRLNLSKNTNIAVQLTTPQDTSFNVNLFNQSDSVDEYIYTNYGSGKLSTIKTLNLKKGLYYIRISHYDGEYNKVPYTLKVIERDTTPPATPTVSKVTTKSTKVTGKAEKGSTVYVYRGKTKLGSANASSTTGAYSVKIAKQKKNTTLSVYAKDKAGNKSKTKTIKVK